MNAASVPVPVGPRPVREAERLPLLDAIRGVALVAILLANLTSFFGVNMVSGEVREQIVTGFGAGILFGIDWFVEGKFYSVFAILFGIGFALQERRAYESEVPREHFRRFFRRRMAVLLGIGLLHMYLVWAGDILALYGAMGLVLPFAARENTRKQAALVIALLLTPLAIHLVIVLSGGGLDLRAGFVSLSGAARMALGGEGHANIELFAGGTAADYRAWNIPYAIARPGVYLESGRPAKVLGLFLIGAWLGRSILHRLDSIEGVARSVALYGGLTGLAGSFVYAWLKYTSGGRVFSCLERALCRRSHTPSGRRRLLLPTSPWPFWGGGESGDECSSRGSLRWGAWL